MEEKATKYSNLIDKTCLLVTKLQHAMNLPV